MVETSLGHVRAERTTLGKQGLWRFDLKAVMGSLLMGILMTLIVAFVGNRLDTALTGGAFPIFGGIAWTTMMGLSTLFFRLPGGIIAGLIQALINFALGFPLAIGYLLANTLGPIGYALVASRLSMEKSVHHLAALVAANVVGHLSVGLALYYILTLPVPVILLSSGVVATVSVIVGTVLTRQVAQAVQKAGVLD
jgi:hypothetical protein